MQHEGIHPGKEVVRLSSWNVGKLKGDMQNSIKKDIGVLSRRNPVLYCIGVLFSKEEAQEVSEMAKFFWQRNSPTGGEDLEKVEFCNTLEDTMVYLPNQEYIFLCGDSNGNFGGWRQEIDRESVPFCFVNPN